VSAARTALAGSTARRMYSTRRTKTLTRRTKGLMRQTVHTVGSVVVKLRQRTRTLVLRAREKVKRGPDATRMIP
jgi:hypothetical protein